MTTVSPGWMLFRPEDTVFVTCEPAEVVTLTVFPFPSETYSVEPLMRLTVPAVTPLPAPTVPPPNPPPARAARAAPPPPPKRAANEDAAVDPLELPPQCFCAPTPPTKAPAATSASTRRPVSNGRRRRRRIGR